MKSLIGVFIGLLLSVSVSAELLLEGRVRLESGEPVADAQVRIFDLSDLQRGAIARATTDGTGYFALPLAVLGGHALPEGFALGPNYPNPFNPSTLIPYQLAASSQVRLEVFNLLGQRIATLVDGARPAGFHTAAWNATDAAGRAVGAGVYIYRMTVGAASQTGRMVLIDGQAGVPAAGAAADFDWLGAEGGSSEGEPVYGLIVSGEGLAPYVDSSFRVEAGMAPVEVVVSAGHSAGKAADDDCALCDLFDALHDDEEGPSPSGKALATLAAPPAPTNLRVEAVTDSSCRVRWDAAEGATDYDVNYKPAVGGRWTNQPHKGIGLYNTITDLEPNTAYRWAVRAENSDGYSAWVFGPNFTTEEEETDETDEPTGSSDAHSNTRSGATVLSLDSSLAGEINPGSDVDYFSVQVRESGTLTVYTTGSLDTQGTLESSSGSRLASNDDGGRDTNFRIEHSVSAGTYYIKVESYRSLTGSYTIHANETPEEEDETLEGEDETPEEEGSDAPVTIPDANLRAAIAAALGKTSGAPITKGEMTTLTTLRARDAGISDLTGLEFATNLQDLRLTDNDISDLSPLRGLTKLQELWLTANDIISDLSPLRGLTKLEWLHLDYNDISDLSPLRGLTKLEWLSLNLNDISDLSPLRGLTKLTDLSLVGNNLSDLSPLRGLTNLTDLGLEGSNLSDLSPLRGLTKLTSLYLSGSNPSDLSPLRGLTNLEWLRLTYNDISDVSPLRGLTNLKLLELTANDISDVSPLRGLTNLKLLSLRGNPLNVSSIDDHIPALKRSGATVEFDRPGSDFDIELVFLSSFTERQKRVVQDAARRWMSIIRGDLPDITWESGGSRKFGDLSYAIPSGERIDDLRIYVISSDDDPDVDYSGKGGWGAPRAVRTESHLPILGHMSFTLDDNYDNYISEGTAIHEIGHVLGIGTIWRDLGFLQDPNGDVHFNGPRAIAAFDDAGGRNYTGKKVPVASDLGHWRLPLTFFEYGPTFFSGELMEPRSGDALSAITIQALADMGYVVDVTQADPYTLVDVTQADPYTLSSAAAKVVAAGSTPDDRLLGRRAPQRTCGVGHQREPIYVVDPQGRVVRTISP